MGFGEGLKARGAQAAWCFDEGRFGLKVWFRKRWCPRGERPAWTYSDNYEWLWLYAAVEPCSGDSFFLLLPHVDATCLQLFADGFGEYIRDRCVALVMDNSGAHKSGRVSWARRVEPMYLPAYSPELNPAEQVFRYLRAKLANRVFEDLAELETAITEALARFWEHPASLRTLTGYPWWLQAAEDIAPLAS